MSADERIVALAIKVGFLTPAQLDEVQKLQEVLTQNGVNLTIAEILVKKDFLNADQMRLLNLGLRHDRMREEDVELGENLVRTGQVPPEVIREGLSTQEHLWSEGRPFPRLQDLLHQRGLLDTQKLQKLRRTRATGGSTRMLVRARPRDDSGETTRATLRMKTPRQDSPALPSVEGCKVDCRTETLKGTSRGDQVVTIVRVEGLLDGHTYKHFEDYLNHLMDRGSSCLILNCEKLDYISSAGIGTLAGAVKRCRDEQGDLRLSNVQERVKRIINLVGLQSMLRLYDLEPKAVQSFQFM